MSPMQAREAKAKFSELLDAAERGETTLITRHGKPVARIEPVKAGRSTSIAEALWAIPGALEIDPDPVPMREVEL